MAGAGYKLFATGDVLTAAQVNTYLNEQTVMVFADSAARTTALSGVLAEGMMSYLQDTNAVEVYNGSSWRIFDNGTFSQASTGAAYFLAGYPGPYGGAYTATIYAPQVATYTQVTGNGLGTSGATTEGATTNFAAFVNATTQYDAMGFTMSGNSYTGTYRVYGLGDA
jgi:hypothetical protein